MNERQLENQPPSGRRTHRVRNSVAALALIGVATAAFENRDLIQVARGYFNDDEMSIPAVEGCADYEPATPDTIVLDPPSLEPSAAQPSDGSASEPVANPAAGQARPLSPQNVTSSARKSGFRDINPFKVVGQYYDYFNHEFARYSAPQSGIEFRFFQFGGRDGLTSFDPETFSEAFHATLTSPASSADPEVNHALDCMREFFFEDRKAEGRVLPIIIPDRPACVSHARVVYDNCNSSGYAWPKVSARLVGQRPAPYDEFVLITAGRMLEDVTPRRQYLNIAHEGAHKLREISEGSNYSFELDPEEAWADHTEELIKHTVPPGTEYVFTYGG